MLWVLPAVVFAVGAVVVLVATTRSVSAARDLQREIVRFGDVRLALVRVRDESASMRRNLANLRRR